MPRRLFKPLSRQRARWKQRWFMRPFRLLLDNPVYWTLNRRNVTRAFALGLFLAFVPLPVHLILAVVLALWWRLNVPAAIAGTLLANPLTMVPMYLAAYWMGCHLLQIHERPFAFELTWEWLTTQLLPVWKPFLLGCLVMGALTAILGYVALGAIWHLSLVSRYHERKASSVTLRLAREKQKQRDITPDDRPSE
jgi:uncharacterized protein (DUF2062 family)